MTISFPAGFQHELATKVSELSNREKDTSVEESSGQFTQKSKKSKISGKINTLQNLTKAESDRGAYKLTAGAHALSVPEVRGLYHQREPSLNDLGYFYAGYETEKPSISAVKALSEEDQAFYHNRHVGKRGRDLLTDEPIEGRNGKAGTLKTSPPLQDQGIQARLIRSEAATAAIDHYMNATLGEDHYLHKLHTHVIQQLDPAFLHSGGKIHLVRPTRDHYASDATLNFFTFCTQNEIASSLNNLEERNAKEAGRPILAFTDYKTSVGLSRTARTEASPIGRLVQQAYFTSDEIAPGDKVIIVDDHVQAGGSVLAMASALKDAEADILGVATLTAHPYCRTGFKLDEKISDHMHSVLGKWDPEGKVLKALSEFGLKPDALTNSEAMILIAYATDPSAADHEINSIQKFKEIEEHLTQGITTMEGEHDSLLPVVKQKPGSAEEIVEDIYKCSNETRKTVQHNPVQRVDVLDWDCLIVNEKEMNYQLMVNALFVAAHNHAESHPDLARIAEAVKPYLSGEMYQDGMPKLCMGKVAYAKYGMENPFVRKDHVPVDLLNTIGSIEPAIKLDEKEKNTLIGILQREFRRQYKSFTRPPVPDDIAEKLKKSSEKVDVPFKDIKLDYMPGAKEFLEKHRMPDSRLVLISNKGDNDLHNEINKLGIAHYFDSIAGVSRETVFNAEKGEHEIVVQNKKPSNYRLNDAIEKNSLAHQMVDFRLYGDQEGDIKQAGDLARNGQSVTGEYVNSQKVDSERSGTLEDIPVDFRRQLD